MKKCPKCQHECRSTDTECTQCGLDLAYFVKKLTREKKALAEKRIRRARLVAGLNRRLEEMSLDQLSVLIEHAEQLCGINKRQNDRLPCLLTADCIIANRAMQKFIRDISLSGAFIEAAETLPVGLEIPMMLSMANYCKPFKITGKITRTTPRGVGIKFETTSQVQTEMIRGIVEKVEGFSQTASSS